MRLEDESKMTKEKSNERFLSFILHTFSLESGITSMEMVVSLAIITLLSAQALVSFTGLNEGVALRRSAQELALAIRTAQNMALGARQIPGVPMNIIAAGIRLSRETQSDAAKYFIFADYCPRNFTYDSAGTCGSLINIDEKIRASEITFPRGVRIDSFSGCVSGSCPDIIHMVFVAPEATATFTDDSGISIGNRVEVILRAQTQRALRVVVVTTGQISIK